MGLNKEVRDFFTDRINRVLNEKRENLMKNVEDKKVKAKTLELFCEKFGQEDLPKAWLSFEGKEKALRAEKEILSNRTINLIGLSRGEIAGEYSRYSNNSMSDLENRASNLFKNEAMLKLYPDIVPQLEKIDVIKDDIHGSVLLATTEPKLVAILTKLLNNYGGEINELLALIPNQE